MVPKLGGWGTGGSGNPEMGVAQAEEPEGEAGAAVKASDTRRRRPGLALVAARGCLADFTPISVISQRWISLILSLLDQAGPEGPGWAGGLGTRGRPRVSRAEVPNSACFSLEGEGAAPGYTCQTWTAGGLRWARRGGPSGLACSRGSNPTIAPAVPESEAVSFLQASCLGAQLHRPH